MRVGEDNAMITSGELTRSNDPNENNPNHSDWVLINRLQLLKTNLQRVQDVVKQSLQAQQEIVQRENIQKFIDIVSNLQDSVNTLKEKIPQNIVFLTDCAFARCPQAQKLSQAKQDLNDILTAAININDQLECIRKRLNSSLSSNEKWGLEVKQSISKHVEMSIIEIDKIEKNSKNIRQSNDSSEITFPFQELWKKLNKIEESCYFIFAEYVDFLRGLAMRNTGFDEGIFEFADQVIVDIVDSRISQITNWNSLTIPDCQEKKTKTLTRLIHLGFPEWTIWAIPLVVSEFGYVFSQENNSLQNFLNSYPLNNLAQEQLHTLVADAFATYTLGPSYAGTAICLRLNPYRQELPSDAMRAYIIFAILEKLDSMEVQNLNNQNVEIIPDIYSYFTNTLKQYWETAIQQAQPLPLTKEEETQLKQWINSLWDVFKDQVFARYLGDEWVKIKDPLVSQLCKMLDPQCIEFERIQLSKELEEQIQSIDNWPRHLLHVAWWVRLRGCLNCSTQPSPKNIAKATLALLQEINYRKNNPSPNSNPNTRGHGSTTYS